MSKGPNNDNEENDAPFKLSLSIPKRIKANLNLDKNGEHARTSSPRSTAL
jgi:hypothetical protein